MSSRREDLTDNDMVKAGRQRIYTANQFEEEMQTEAAVQAVKLKWLNVKQIQQMIPLITCEIPFG